ncbi:bifunctional phosphoribosylaminoimidazolecarboxamide formyltransferase/IMP cyclohydrolase PurH [Treponema phagedenis]|uniref:Bifunctional purine biosynthesis protein PurH n=1 Tax=Treponema phagedenis TaxID=162 RepID=A0A0B7GX43_TREPH|nr:bifunctional phosphoribosylaminoimidazolecarboxamide formyltransferase/IMP cyclohydrolase [Treponema phagedenis]NVP24949.1 bifunctional phosphoribosylaminoimidazolecarboxamide formyltransferase/IMP cyclohydrolase [Treponema phagedenis]QEJ94419.1 bifunctional phosphoribosylaminoimidazolecarboxamide formyltransferase/IMP cyclohydrolase [Treponema phagedenis]QEJ96662.1 bifunctional phosphoribosylaminoimidazolecarboxamide formyltransferase/IMP cyclohydrolase [Treponema phagedenis]QEK01701.1 bifu
MKTALISVYDKTDIADFANGLIKQGWQIISTGGTAEFLRKAKVPVQDVRKITGFPEILGGRVKTLHPILYGGILFRRNLKTDKEDCEQLHINPIDMIVNNLYPFEAALKKDKEDHAAIIENIDIGGVSMIRAAAKNYADVYTVTDPSDYAAVLAILQKDDQAQMAMRKKLAAKAFSYTAYYDSIISNYFNELAGETFPERISFTYKKTQALRYGENPHQQAALYQKPDLSEECMAEFKQLHGKELSYNNLIDTYAAVKVLKEFDEPTVVAIKHTNPCGIASAATLSEAFEKTHEADPESIFGGIISVNREMDSKTADAISKIFIEIVIAPSFSEDAITLLTQKKNIRLLEMPKINSFKFEPYSSRQVLNGVLIQEADSIVLKDDLTFASKRKPSSEEMDDLLFAWKAVKNINSNAIVLAKNKQTLAIGQGEVKRFWSVEKSIARSIHSPKGAVLASDGFFFEDTIQHLAEHGVTAVIQPGGSVKDPKVIELADQFNIALVITNIRHFKH